MKLLAATASIVLAALCAAPALAQNTPMPANQALQAFNNMTPAQRQEIMQEAQKEYQSMTAAQRAQVQALAMKQWQNLSPAAREQMEKEAKAAYQNLTPEERKQQQAQWNSMTPDQQKAFRQQVEGVQAQSR